ncbi:MAG: glycosyltransferase, partial [Deltaproteobacteria bacterium]|nr:glycosyltransferase [Deltaproteobacteria bacterium]
NRGKGFAVRIGMLNARGNLLLFADADGSAPIAELPRLEEALKQGAQIAIGSRALVSPETHVKARWYRRLPGRIFNLSVNLLVLPEFADTQCGFKLFTAKAARFLFERQRANQFSFDIELLFMAHQVGLKVVEVPINWQHVRGSKVSLLKDSIKMFVDIFVFKIRHRKLSPDAFRASTTADEVK